jgi:hypothetical protein
MGNFVHNGLTNITSKKHHQFQNVTFLRHDKPNLEKLQFILK